MRGATPLDKSLIVQMLAVSFDANKSVNYIAKQDQNRVQRILQLMDCSFDDCYEFGEVWISDDRKACALILFPERKRTSLRSLLRNLKLALFVVGLKRVSKILKREKMISANHPAQPFAYLLFLGVDASVQGKGNGSSLMRELISRYDQEQRPIYLETSMERNLPFYKNLGLEIFQTLELSYTLYQLRRLI